MKSTNSGKIKYTHCEPLPQNNSDSVEFAIEMLKHHEILGIDIISPELIHTSGRTLLSGFHKFINGVFYVDNSAVV
jgi:hypothetical protein